MTKPKTYKEIRRCGNCKYISSNYFNKEYCAKFISTCPEIKGFDNTPIFKWYEEARVDSIYGYCNEHRFKGEKDRKEKKDGVDIKDYHGQKCKFVISNDPATYGGTIIVKDGLAGEFGVVGFCGSDSIFSRPWWTSDNIRFIGIMEDE